MSKPISQYICVRKLRSIIQIVSTKHICSLIYEDMFTGRKETRRKKRKRLILIIDILVLHRIALHPEDLELREDYVTKFLCSRFYFPLSTYISASEGLVLPETIRSDHRFYKLVVTYILLLVLPYVGTSQVRIPNLALPDTEAYY